MVKTRHSGDAEDTPPKFLSLKHEKIRQTKARQNDNGTDGFSTAYNGSDNEHNYNIFEDKVVDSRLRPRTGPRRAYNYLDADSSDDDTVRRQRRYHSKPEYSPRRSQFNREMRHMKQEMIEERKFKRMKDGSRKMSPPPEHKSSHSEEEEDEDMVRRRSSRQRRQMFDTLNQSFLVKSTRLSKDSNEDDMMKDHDSDEEGKQEFSDMYSRVKRKRIQVKRNMYGVPINDSDSESELEKENENNNKNDESEDEDDDEEEEDTQERKGSERQVQNEGTTSRTLRTKPVIVKSYSLRQHKPRTDLYKAPVEERRIKKSDHCIFAGTPTKKTNNQTYQSPAQRRNIRKRSAFHSSSSSTSSSDSESSDEKNFKRRKAKSMAKARSRMLPMNFSANAVPPSNVIKDRVKSGASLADVEPMNIDRNISFNSIGGLGKHIRALKEMVVFPLLYDKVFQRFKVDPPRGVLFYGPPGTGKTLVARALANECSHGDKRVAFFMRKGADCLSKWVGESERQLRLLFDQAYKFRPSIIFFDEIDGLAPVRSSRQDQIHSSIVSTLLALMDGLDSRGEIVVIGATNRIDSLDPALRRPGRFDREFLFPLPSLEARKQILKIQTSSWTPKLNDSFISELAEKCVGYCGADLKALCTEAAMLALRRRYPQIYISNEALELDESSINVSAKDFFDAVNNIIPTSQRAVNTPARALSRRVCPLLQRQLDRVMNQLSDCFPPCLAQISSLDAAATPSQAQALAESGIVWDELASDEDEDTPSIFVTTSSKGNKHNVKKNTAGTSFSSEAVPTYLNFTCYATSRPVTFRPRLLLAGLPGQGQTTYIAPAVVHKMENLPVHVLDLPALYAVTAKTPEESCANVFHEAKRKCPSIIYLPYINQWWNVMADTLRATLLTLIHDLNPSTPLLLLATSEQPYHQLDPMLQSLFGLYSGEVIAMTNPTAEERKEFFKDLLLRQACRPPPQKKQAGEVIALLEQSKKVLLKTSRKEPFSPRPAFIYPFTTEVGLQQDELEELLQYKKQKPRPKREWCKEKIKKSKINTVLRNLSGKGRKSDLKRKIDGLSLRLPAPPVLMRSFPKSIHHMRLRQRPLVSRLNSNQSSRQSTTESSQSHINKSLMPVQRNLMKAEGAFKYPLELGCSRRLLQRGAKYISKSLSFCNLPQNEMNASHDLYVRRLLKLEKRLSKAGPYQRKRSLSNRHQRYLRRLRRLDAAYTKTASTFLDRYNQTSSQNVAQNSSVLSCGSFQMLYKNEDHQTTSNKLALPLNLRDLGNRSCTNTTFELNSRKLEARPAYKTLSLTMRQQTKYNLRNMKKMCYLDKLKSKQEICNLKRSKVSRVQRMLETLPRAAPVKPRELTSQELKQLVEKEELTLMELRIFLRDVLNKLGSDKKFSIFAKPVNIDDAPDYYEIIEQPMDLSTMMSKIDLHEYNTVRSFMNDIDLVCSNALEYNPNRGPMDRVIRHRACALKDTAYAIIKTELDKDFEKMCVEIEESRKRRGEKSTNVPDFYYTKPKQQQQHSSRSQPRGLSYLESNRPHRSIPKPDGERFSRRVRGLNIESVAPLEVVEKVYRESRSPNHDKNNSQMEEEVECENSSGNQSSNGSGKSKEAEKIELKDVKTPDPKHLNLEGSKKSQQGSSKSSSKAKRTQCVWCKPKRKKPRLTFSRFQTRQSTIDKEGQTQKRVVGNDEDDGDRTADDSQTSISHPLEVDVSNHTDEEKQMKSPSRASLRHQSSLINGPVGVTTRRSSMSPKGGSTNCKLDTAPNSEDVNINGPVISKVHCESKVSTQKEEDSLLKEVTVSTWEKSSSDESIVSDNENFMPFQVVHDNINGEDSAGPLRVKRYGDLDDGSEIPAFKSENLPALHVGELLCIREHVKNFLKPYLLRPGTSRQHEEHSQQSVPAPVLSESPIKSTVVKRLDLDSVATDSGVGSSLDSNGDSRDSTDHKTEEKASSKSAELKDTNENCSVEFREKASAFLNEPAKNMVIDSKRLASLLDHLVAQTDKRNVEDLEKIYSHLSQVIYRHRHEYNRTTMIKGLEQKVEELTNTVPSTSCGDRH